MLERLMKKVMTKVSIKWILISNCFITLVSVVTLLVISVNIPRLNEVFVAERRLMILLYCNYILVIIAAIATSVFLVRYRKGTEYLLKTIRNIAAGEFNAIEDRTEEDNENDSAYQALHQVVEELKGSKEVNELIKLKNLFRN